MASLLSLKSNMEQGSVKAALQLASLINLKHENEDECYQCNKIANCFVFAIQYLKNDTILCNATLFSLVQQSIRLVELHSKMDISWISALIKELNDIAKQIKDESSIVDRYIQLPLPLSFQFDMDDRCTIQEEFSYQNTNTIQEEYGRAIRITIYYFRASVYEKTNISQAIHYYRKCLSVLPTQFDFHQKNLQQSALDRLLQLNDDCSILSRTSSISSRTSISSSCTSMVCANCGIEKKRMPVCSRCKSQSYCTIRCLKLHKSIHDTECH